VCVDINRSVIHATLYMDIAIYALEMSLPRYLILGA
jgi:hypothetical protein